MRRFIVLNIASVVVALGSGVLSAIAMSPWWLLVFLPIVARFAYDAVDCYWIWRRWQREDAERLS
jgi:hypothetical protein